MTNAELIQKIRAEIERLAKRADRRTDKDHASHNAEMERYGEDYWNGYGDLAYALLSFLSTLESERPEPYNPIYDEAYLNEKIKKATESWKGVDVDAMLAECRGYDEEESEKPVPADLEEETDLYLEENYDYNSEYDTLTPNDGFFFSPRHFRNLARHFAQWQKEQDEKELSDLLTIAHLQGADQMKEQMLKEAVKWLVDDDYDELTDKGKFILGSVGIGYNGYYIPYSGLLKLPKEEK